MVNGIMWFSPVGIGSVICAKILAVKDLARYGNQKNGTITDPRQINTGSVKL